MAAAAAAAVPAEPALGPLARLAEADAGCLLSAFDAALALGCGEAVHVVAGVLPLTLFTAQCNPLSR